MKRSAIEGLQGEKSLDALGERSRTELLRSRKLPTRLRSDEAIQKGGTTDELAQ
jgi:hypothetical protein